MKRRLFLAGLFACVALVGLALAGNPRRFPVVGLGGGALPAFLLT